MLSATALLLALLPAVATAPAPGPAVQGGPVQFTALPQGGQLYPRDAGNMALVEVAGIVTDPGWAEIAVEVLRDGAPWRLQTQPLQYQGGQASFSIGIHIPAELAGFDFLVTLRGGGTSLRVARRENVVAGDAYLIQGQSNAVAADYFSEHLANLDQSPWVRSYGTASLFASKVRADRKWTLAEGETANAHGSTGAWGLRLGRLLSERTGVPVAILNGAVGGTPIKYHLRNDADPEDLGTNYGRLLWRAREAGLRDAARAIFWYQGESDGGFADRYRDAFLNLYADWRADYPGLERIYVVQVREGCGGPSVELRDLQRQSADFLPLVSVMSTTAVPGHDGCHYVHEGYAETARRLLRLVARDLYGWPDPGDIEAPNIARASWGSAAHDEVLLEFRNAADTLLVDPGAEQDFELVGGGSIVSATASGNTITLLLAGPSNATAVSYTGHSGDGPWVTNRRGVGALVFYQVPIQP